MQRKIIPILLTLSLILSGLLALNSIQRLQGNARVVNYTGIVRGGTQQLVKQEISGVQNDELLQRLDGIIKELKSGEGNNDLIRLQDESYQRQLKVVSTTWESIKQRIKDVRKGEGKEELFSLSEQSFQETDEAVHDAEAYSEQMVSKTMWMLSLLTGICLLAAAFIAFFTSRITKKQEELQKSEDENRRKSESLSMLAKQLQAPMNEISELLYITDIDNYDLLFLNEAGQRLFQVDNFYGKKCYKVLQGRDTPCLFCNNHQLTDGEIISWEYTNPVVNRHFLLKDRKILWDGRDARMEIAFDITENEAEKRKLKNMLDGEQMIVECIHHLYENRDVLSSINEVLKAVGSFFHADRVYLINIRNQMSIKNQEWCREGVAHQIDKLHIIPEQQIVYLLKQLQTKRSIIWKDITTLDENMKKIYQALQRENIKCVAAVPLESSDTLIGLLGVDNPADDKMQNITALLQTLSYYIMLTLKRDSIEKQLSHLSYYDVLTSFYNRNRYMEDVKKLSSCHKAIGVVYLDINGLKDINDEFGHAKGDEIITEAASRMKTGFADANIYRIGGDEFVILCPDIEQITFQNRIREFKGSFYGESMLQVAIGVTWSADSGNILQHIAQADASMYEDKRIYYRKHMHSKRYRHYNDELLYLVNETLLKEELQLGHFHVYLQPKIDVSSGASIGAEALIRYINKDGALILPNDFLPLLEDHQLISKIDYFVFEQVCLLLCRWQKNMEFVPQISVNLSRQTLTKASIVEDLVAICQRHNIACSRLEVEISEHNSILSDTDLIILIRSLKAAGFRVSLDDFGTEYANLAILSSADFDVLKLDRSIVMELGNNQRTKMVVKAIMELCVDMNITIVAEGIETKEQLDALTSCGIKIVQGFYFSKPLCIQDYQRSYMKEVVLSS